MIFLILAIAFFANEICVVLPFDGVNHKSDLNFLPNNLKRVPRHNAKINSYRWENATVPYRFNMSKYSE